MPRLARERLVVQDPFVRYAVEAGWTFVSRDEALRLRRGENSPILWDVFIDRVQALNPGTVDYIQAEEQAKRLMRVAPNIEGNLQAWEFLKGLKTVFVASENRERNLRLIDFDNPQRNTFQVTDEFTFSNGVYNIRADVVLLVNGIPIILIETKAATHLEGTSEALEQVRRYHRESPELLALMQVFTITHLVHYYYGATWNLAVKNLFNWKDESAGQDFETLVKTFVARERVLRVLRDFILFTRKDDELAKVILRPHQMRAAERVLQRARDPKKRRGLIWHTQGSGKTYTMITIAKRLIQDPLFENPTVLMLVDRTELETQLFGNLAAMMGIGQVQPVTSKRGLVERIRRDERGLIVSMIHKFDEMPANLNPRKNIFVLVDEAHRSTGGDLGNYLVGALPNATFVGFTGTPIDRTAHGQGTFWIFGRDDQPRGYLDKYSIAESISDGTTVPLFYSLAPNELRVDRETLEREFWSLVELEGVSDQEDLDRVLRKAVTLRNMLKNRERVQRVAEFVANHFRNTVQPMGYKAFLVAVDREACTFYKEALDRYLPEEYSKVVISAASGDEEQLERYHLSDKDEKELRKAFIKPDKDPKIVIVTEKLLTGFDAPVLYCMYLDKPMRDHVLLQAIARVNRPYEDQQGRHKPGGFVLDFVGVLENLEKALAFDSQDMQGVIEGLDVLEARFRQRMAQARAEYLPLVIGKSADKAAESALEAFRAEDKRQTYYRFFQELEDLYEILSPDVFLREYIDDYHRLADLYDLLRAAYEAKSPSYRELARKAARLVQDHAHGGEIRNVINVLAITPDTLEHLAQSNQPDTVKVFNLLKSIEKKMEEEAAAAPYLVSIGERAQAIADAFKQHLIEAEQALEQLKALLREITEAEQAQAERNISGAPFAILWLLKKQDIPVDRAEAVARSMVDEFARHPHWRTSEHQKREARQALYRQLLPLCIEDLTKTVDHIMSVITREHLP